MSGNGTLRNFKTMLAEAALPETVVPICLRGDLAADHELAERELEQAQKQASDSLVGNGAAAIAERIQGLEEQRPAAAPCPLIPAMGFMARLRNLRNFDQHGLTDGDVSEVLHMLTDEDQVRASRQLPLRFLSAFRAVSHLRWAYPLERALELSLANVPGLPGNTLILVDTSGSMADRLSEKSDLQRWDAAAAFGLALARRCETAAVVSYSAAGWGGQLWKQFPQIPGESLLTAIKRWQTGGYFLGGGTDTVEALRQTFNPAAHHRVILLTDEQAAHSRYGTVDNVLPANVPLYTVNLAGYRGAGGPSNPYRITLGGLTDQMFALIPTVESGRDGTWPWVGRDGTWPWVTPDGSADSR